MDALRAVLFIFILVLFARVVLSLIIVFAREWKPTGAMLVLTEGVFSISDPPVKALRRIIPPFTVGQVRIDVAFMILLFGCMIAYNLLGWA